MWRFSKLLPIDADIQNIVRTLVVKVRDVGNAASYSLCIVKTLGAGPILMPAFFFWVIVFEANCYAIDVILSLIIQRHIDF